MIQAGIGIVEASIFGHRGVRCRRQHTGRIASRPELTCPIPVGSVRFERLCALFPRFVRFPFLEPLLEKEERERHTHPHWRLSTGGRSRGKERTLRTKRQGSGY